MKRLALLSLLAVAACPVYPSPSATNRFACQTSADCGSNETCGADNFCLVNGATVGTTGTTGGSTSGTTSGTTSGGPSCGTGCDDTAHVCDVGNCLPKCIGSNHACGGTMVCDQAVEGCVDQPPCVGNICASDGGVCLAGVCVASPPSAGNDIFPDAGLANVATVNLIVIVEEFPGVTTANLSGMITLIPDAGTPVLDAGIAPVPGAGIGAVFSAPWGPLSAIVTGPGLMTTYFPNLLALDNGTLDLRTAVPTSLYQDGGHIVWAGSISAFQTGGSSVSAAYSVGLSPSLDAISYDAGQQHGEFQALNEPYAATDYVVAVEPNDSEPYALLSGTFVPPLFSPTEPIAVALVYPNFSQ